MAVIGINYEGANHDYNKEGERIETPGGLKYKSVYLYHQDDEKVFDSGNFIKDWFDAKRFFSQELMDTEPHLSASSSCDHFHMDGADFDSAYLHVVDGKPVLKYVNTEDPNWFMTQRDVYENGWEFFVKEGTQPTWEELKEICKNG
jgi:hypothetical protein